MTHIFCTVVKLIGQMCLGQMALFAEMPQFGA